MIKVIVKVYDGVKYDIKSKVANRVEYDIAGFKVVCGGKEAEEIESMTDSNSADDYHEYLVLDLGNGETATFRNSYVDMFRW